MSNENRFEIPLYAGYSYRIVQDGYNADPQWVFVVPEPRGCGRDVEYYRHAKERVDALLDELIAASERIEGERKHKRAAQCRRELERIGGELTQAPAVGGSDGV